MSQINGSWMLKNSLLVRSGPFLKLARITEKKEKMVSGQMGFHSLMDVVNDHIGIEQALEN